MKSGGTGTEVGRRTGRNCPHPGAIEQRDAHGVTVTFWTGATSVIVSIRSLRIRPEELEITASGSRLTIRGRSFRRELELSCAVGAQPVRIRCDGGTLYLLFPRTL